MPDTPGVSTPITEVTTTAAAISTVAVTLARHTGEGLLFSGRSRVLHRVEEQRRTPDFVLGVPTWEQFPMAEQFPMVVEECLMAQHRMEEDSMVAVVADMEVATAEADTVAEGEADEDRITA